MSDTRIEQFQWHRPAVIAPHLSVTRGPQSKLSGPSLYLLRLCSAAYDGAPAALLVWARVEQ